MIPRAMETRDGVPPRASVPLTPRQAEAAELVARYRAVAGEPPSYSWLARRLNVSRTRAFHLIARVERVAVRPTR